MPRFSEGAFSEQRLALCRFLERGITFYQSLISETLIRARGARFHRALLRDADDVEAAQRQTLQRILSQYHGTEFGKAFDILPTLSPRELSDRLPIQSYETLAPWILRQLETPEAVLTREQPSHYGVTSGTTGEPKYIPVLKSTLRWNKRALTYNGYDAMQVKPKAFSGRILGITGAACEAYTPRGTPIGSKSGEAYENIPRLVKSKYVLPNEVLSINDSRLKYLLMLRLALNYDDITYFQTSNTSTIVLLADLLNEEWKHLVADVEHGGFFLFDQLSPTQQRAMIPLLRPRRGRALALQSIHRRAEQHAKGKTPRIRLGEIFPKLQAVGCWLSGSCGIFYNRLREEFPPEVIIRDIGYIATEVLGTVPFEGDGRGGLPIYHYVYYEFIPREAWENGSQETFGLHQLKEGEQYYLIISTADGLIRYAMNDIVEVTGFLKTIPRLRFVQKGAGVTNITGEKLSEYQVVEAARRVEETFGIASVFYFFVAEETACCYHIYYEPLEESRARVENSLEELVESFDKELCELNREYAAKRESARLHLPVITTLSAGTVHYAREVWLAKGRREAQFKLVHLQIESDLEFDFHSRARKSTRAADEKSSSKVVSISEKKNLTS